MQISLEASSLVMLSISVISLSLDSFYLPTNFKLYPILCKAEFGIVVCSLGDMRGLPSDLVNGLEKQLKEIMS
jgi:hypothetical protein